MLSPQPIAAITLLNLARFQGHLDKGLTITGEVEPGIPRAFNSGEHLGLRIRVNELDVTKAARNLAQAAPLEAHQIVDQASIIVNRLGLDVTWQEGRTTSYLEIISTDSLRHPAERQAFFIAGLNHLAYFFQLKPV